MPADARAQATAQGARRTEAPEGPRPRNLSASEICRPMLARKRQRRARGELTKRDTGLRSTLTLLHRCLSECSHTTMRGWSPRVTSRCEQSPARIPFCGLAATPAHNGTHGRANRHSCARNPKTARPTWTPLHGKFSINAAQFHSRPGPLATAAPTRRGTAWTRPTR